MSGEYPAGASGHGQVAAMTGADDSGDAVWGADRLYAARSAMDDAAWQRRRIGVAELLRFLTIASVELPLDAQRDLFANPRLRADFQRLKRRLRLFELPLVAAASAGGITSRMFEGGSVRVHPSRLEGQVYMVFQLRATANAPRALLFEDNASRIMKRLLPAPDALGQVVLVLDRSNPDDELFLQLFVDPTTTGTFLP
jgi:hypothetical protein